MLNNELEFFAYLNGILDSRIEYLTNLNEQLRRHCANFTALRTERCRVEDISLPARAPQDSIIETKEPDPVVFNALDSLDAILAKAKVIRNAIPLPSAPREQQLIVRTSKAKSNKSAHTANVQTPAKKGIAPDGRKRNNATSSTVASNVSSSNKNSELVVNQHVAVEAAATTWPLRLKSKYELLTRRNFASKLFVGLLHRISSDDREKRCKSGSSSRSIPFYGCTWERDSLRRMRDVASIRESQHDVISGVCEADIAAFMTSLKSAMLKLLSKHAALILKMKMKLQHGSSSSRLSSDEHTDLLELWYKGHRLMQLYQFYCSSQTQSSSGGSGSGIVEGNGLTSSDSGESPSQEPGVVSAIQPDPPNRQHIRHTYMEKHVLEEVVRQLHALPLCCPVSVTLDEMPSQQQHPSRRKVDRDVGSTKRPFAAPSEESRRRSYCAISVDTFHTKVKVRVQYLVESLLGKSAMKGNLRQLKECCYQAARFAQSRPQQALAEQDSQWISALRLYRAVYCALVDECKFHHSCTILKK